MLIGLPNIEDLHIIYLCSSHRMSMPQGGGGGYPAFSSLRLGYHKGFRPHSAPNPFLTPNGHPGMPPPPPSQYDPSRPKASHELHLRIESCIEETKALGQERRRVELDVASYLGRNSYPLVSSVPRLPPNPTRLDKLINDQFKEHAKVGGEGLRDESLLLSLFFYLDGGYCDFDGETSSSAWRRGDVGFFR